MAIQKSVRVMVWAVADGESTSFTFDLNTSPYWVGSGVPNGMSGTIVNWVGGASASSKFPPPVGVRVLGGAVSAILDSPAVTVEVPVQPAGTDYNVVLDLLFD